MTTLFTQPGAFTAPAFTAPTQAAPVFEHPPTIEQAAILEAARQGDDLVIEAGAGTGKTSTLKMVAAASMRRGLYLAYNRAIADDARASFPASVQCATAHSLAFRAVGHQFAHRLNGPRLPAREVARFLKIPAVLDLGAHALTSVKVARIVMDAVAAFCHSSSDEPAWWHIHDIPGLDVDPYAMTQLRQAVLPMVVKAWEDLISLDGKLKFTHDHYLKMWALGRPVLPAELVFLDEAQDANPVIAQVVEDQSSQTILVGDQSQAIYGWRGAVDAMESFEGARFQLSQSFRFGQKIADEANVWLELLDAPLRLTGNPAKDSGLGVVYPGDAILCRTNAGAIGQAMAALGSGLRPAMVGGGDDIRRLARACQDLRNGRGTEHPELMAFSSWAEVKEYAEHDAGGADLKTLVKLVDSHGPERILKVVDQLVDEHNADVKISTGHRAKGREFETVRLASDWNEPYDKDGNLVPAEAMLTYVAVTRAKQVLDCRTLTSQGGIHSPDEVVHRTPLAAEQAVPAGGDSTAMDVLTPDPERVDTDLPAEMVGWLDYAKKAAENEAGWKAVKDAAIQKVKDHLAARGLDKATVAGRDAVSWKESAPGGQLDGQELKKDHPDIYAKYYKPKKASRPFNFLGEWK
ncbi:UvrD-helicase domain-containing protein [Nonomuraea sp. NPDC059194]|uniref:UvrD-helicase domain-containing protein n=1 Tax=Nonomuraea sp. NPDC059194 TaxID=3346764 RepID=UPI0036919664